MKRNFNLEKQLKNPVFWIATVGTLLASANVDPTTLTSWKAVTDMFITIGNNPVKLFGMLITFIGIINNNATSGIGDNKNLE